MHGLAHNEGVAQLDRAIGLEEVGLQVHLEDVARDALHGVVKRQHANLALSYQKCRDLRSVGQVVHRLHCDEVAETHGQVLADDLHVSSARHNHLVHNHAANVAVDSVTICTVDLPRFPCTGLQRANHLDGHNVSLEESELGNLLRIESDDRVFILIVATSSIN